MRAMDLTLATQVWRPDRSGSRVDPRAGHGRVTRTAGTYPILKESSVKISDVLRNKGGGVVTVKPDDSVSALLAMLAEHGIGACVVSADGTHVDGIVSERDVVRHLHSNGPGILEGAVASIMTSEVTTGTSADNIEDMAATMTEMRVRHVPILDSDGNLSAIVSIGDIVKHRLSELQSERDQLRDYITH
jgi:CBS domain-containing protein